MDEDYSRAPIVLESNPRIDNDSQVDEYSNMDKSTARLKFREFFRNFRLEQIYIYRDELVSQYNYECIPISFYLFDFNC